MPSCRDAELLRFLRILIVIEINLQGQRKDEGLPEIPNSPRWFHAFSTDLQGETGPYRPGPGVGPVPDWGDPVLRGKGRGAIGAN